MQVAVVIDKENVHNLCFITNNNKNTFLPMLLRTNHIYVVLSILYYSHQQKRNACFISVILETPDNINGEVFK